MSELNQNRDPRLVVDAPGIVGFYEREFYPLSNFSSFQVQWRGKLWPTSEHGYQAAKFMEVKEDLVERVLLARSAHEAFALARAHTEHIRSDWAETKVDVMTDLLRHKLGQHAYVRSKLIATKDWKLVEDSEKDGFWGIGPDGQGQNQLGTIWMKLREELQDGQITIQG